MSHCSTEKKFIAKLFIRMAKTHKWKTAQPDLNG